MKKKHRALSFAELRKTPRNDRAYLLKTRLTDTERLVLRVLFHEEKGLTAKGIHTALVVDTLVAGLGVPLAGVTQTRGYLPINEAVFDEKLTKKLTIFFAENSPSRASVKAAEEIAALNAAAIPHHKTIKNAILSLRDAGLVETREMTRLKGAFIAYLPKRVHDWLKEFGFK